MISTHSIVADYFNYRLRNQTDSNNPLLPYVIKMASKCEIKCRFNFSSASSIINAENIHREIARELFNNNNITWTYVINFISFSAMLAENIIHKQPQNEDSIIGLFIDRTVDLIDSNLHLWFEQHHHWSGFLNTCEQQVLINYPTSQYTNLLIILGTFACGIWYLTKD